MTESNDTTARFVAAFNAHDERALNELHADDIKFNAPGGFKATNAKDATAYATTWLKAFPDGKMKVRSEITSGPWVVQEILMEGTHTAPLESPTGTIAPTYKKVVGYGVQLLRVENGKIAEARIYFDQLDQMTQLGLMPAPTAV
ncbi:MAG: ester cyclase [Chloroflexi bacterium]|nr:MAG: ester cyclase [Chloroflexota bacterium]TMF08499.1 MAG: ester cyclase [Chloroflexota bacterium]